MGQLKNSLSQWGLVSRLFHWLSALLILSMLCVGFYMVGMTASSDKWQIYGLHKSVGVTLLAIMSARLIWCLTQVTPQLPGMPQIQYYLARSSVPLFYSAVFIMIFSGILMSNAGGFPIIVFGEFELPALIGKNPNIGQYAKQIHGLMGWSLSFLIGTHTLAAFYHQFCRRDRLLKRMWSGKAI